MNNANEILITSAERPILYKNFNEVDFLTLVHGHFYDYNFLSSKGITFEDYISSYYLTGNQLIYFPQLAIKLRELNDYPLLKRTFKIDETLKGMEFIEHFYQTTKKFHAIFIREYGKVSNEIDQLVKRHGTKRQTPIITALEKNDETHYYYHSYVLFINDVCWHVEGYSHENKKITERLNLRLLLGISHKYTMLKIEEIKTASPFIALRLGKTWRHKGQVYWFNLDTGQQVSKSEVNCPK